MLDTLTRLTGLYPAHARPLGPPVPLGNAGGLSGARLWRFDSGSGPMVARAWPLDGPGPEALRAIHAWLARLADLDFIPVPIATLDNRTLIELDERSWEVAPWRPGSADVSRPPSPGRLRAAFSALGAVHQRLAFESTLAPSPGLAARLDEASELLASELAQLEAVVRHEASVGSLEDLGRNFRLSGRTMPDESARFLDARVRSAQGGGPDPNPTPGSSISDPLAEPALRWIALARDGLPSLVAQLRREASSAIPLQPVIRDARPAHFLFTGDRLTGLVDFGAMGLESPAADLARLIGEWIGPDLAGRSAALDAYTAVRPIDASEARHIDVFAESGAWLGPAR
ncbi:MAG TPA: phosphotransferase, partial [Isosphaeraceae bacterium]